MSVSRKQKGISKEMWGCLGSIGAALITGICALIVGLPTFISLFKPTSATPEYPTAITQPTALVVESALPPTQILEPTENNILPTSSSAVSSELVVKSVEINVSKNSDNYDGNVIFTVERIEILANNKMKWYVSFWNKTGGDAGLAFAGDRSYIVDEFGIKYKILSMSPSNFIDSGVQAGVQLPGWLEFDVPENDAKEFSLYLVQWSFGSNQLKLNDPLVFSLTEPLIQK